MSEYTPEQQGRLLGSAVEGVAWALIEYETDTSDRGVSEEHYGDAVKRARELLPTLVHPAPVVSEEPDWEYGISYAQGNDEFEGQDLATIQRRVKYIRRQGGYYSRTVRAIRRRPAGDAVPVEQEDPQPATGPCAVCGKPGAVRVIVGKTMCDACVASFMAWTRDQEGETDA